MNAQGLAYVGLTFWAFLSDLLGLDVSLSTPCLWKVSAGLLRAFLSIKPLGSWKGHLILFPSEPH